jgi:hypothetical protein
LPQTLLEFPARCRAGKVAPQSRGNSLRFSLRYFHCLRIQTAFHGRMTTHVPPRLSEVAVATDSHARLKTITPSHHILLTSLGTVSQLLIRKVVSWPKHVVNISARRAS